MTIFRERKNNISRRSFIRSSIYGSMVLMSSGLSNELFASEEISHLCILHTNDTHSRIDPYPENDPNYPLMGGYARRAAAINKIRNENKHVLLLDSGDILQGTPYFNMYGGEPEFKLMTRMGYDAATIGNHEFDNGLEGLKNILPHAGFPFINSNYDFSHTILKDQIKTYKVFEKGGIRIGIYGLGIELEGLVGKNLYDKTRYMDPLKIARDIEFYLKEDKKCDLIVCLSHLGFEYETDKINDKFIAKKTRFTDIILGGHTHTFISPTFETANAANQIVRISQMGYGGVRLGRMDVYFNPKTGNFLVESATTNISENQVS
ncbi:MAG: bifunctional metallophosphatase/5'-nucleotidase [Bacteroidota bacterium]